MIQTPQSAREKWRQINESQRASGQSVAAYCRERDVSQASLYAWRRRFRDAEPTAEFIEVKTVEHAGAAGIEVCLAGGRRVVVRRGFDRELLVETIGVLEGLP